MSYLPRNDLILRKRIKSITLLYLVCLSGAVGQALKVTVAFVVSGFDLRVGFKFVPEFFCF